MVRFGGPLPARDGTFMVELQNGSSEIGPTAVALNEAGASTSESLDLVQPTLDDVCAKDRPAPRGAAETGEVGK